MHAGERGPSFQLQDGYGEAFSSREALRRAPIVHVLHGEPLLQHRHPRDRGRLARHTQPRRFVAVVS